MERPIHRVRGRRRPQEPPPPIVHAAPQSWGDPPPPRRRPQVGPGLPGRGEPTGPGLAARSGAARLDEGADGQALTAAEGRGEPESPPARRPPPAPGGGLTSSAVRIPARSRCPPPARPQPLPNPPRAARAPPPAPPARPGPPDAGLAPPQPCGPEGRGLVPGPRPLHQAVLLLAAVTRSRVSTRTPQLRGWGGLAGSSHPFPSSSHLPLSRPLGGFSSYSRTPGRPSALSHWPAVAPTIGPPHLSVSWKS
ncbi:proline-rich protein HaeIII subfamily 1-like [Perognathus longimembris pacificus]|uniref:proline-rich protein HaeIII subfamily 1-like n=1 Tax=Perognathus longimembris pacificus TaxID=214514 RepID=UPI00201972D9|nr:proline-rich protein HaeIII subfamily 1-like [Perognathus longimembris pacificus]